MKNLLPAALLLLSGQLACQNLAGCGFNQAYQELFELDPSARQRFEAAASYKTASPSQTQSNMVYVIPVVFHVLHLGGSENISDAQIHNAMMILNRDFRKLNPDTTQIVTAFKNIAADCTIQFSLATLDENGNCTNGITRHYDSRTNWTTVSPSNYAYTWDPTKYLNIYVVKALQSGAAGYTFLPGTASGAMDAIVVLHSYVGSIGTANSFTSRTLTHEAGHWLNLSHVWGSTNNPGVACGDDGVNDTPITKGHTSCNLTSNACTPGVTENVQNYMDYSYCSRMFTAGQKNRMHACLNSSIAGRDNLWTYNNLVETGVENPVSNCAPKAGFFNSSTVTCVGNSITFTDFSYNAPVTGRLWSSNLASNTSTLQNGVLTFSGTGIADVKLKVWNSSGADSVTKQSVLVIAAAGTGNANVPESFENITFPGSHWQAGNPQFGSGFQLTGQAAATGSNCLWLNNYYDSPSGAVAAFSPAYDLDMAVVAQLSFKYAYARKSAQDNDQFRVSVSTNCGLSWTQVFARSGATLSTTGTLVSGPYLNPAPTEWVTESANLLPYSGSPVVHIKFEFAPGANGTGNNFYLDDINLGIVTGVPEAKAGRLAAISPNPFSDCLRIAAVPGNRMSQAKLYSADMKLIAGFELDPAASEQEITMPQWLQPGLYFLSLVSGQGQQMFRVIRN